MNISSSSLSEENLHSSHSFFALHKKGITLFLFCVFFTISGIFLLENKNIFFALFCFFFSLYSALLWALFVSRSLFIWALPAVIFLAGNMFFSGENAFIISILLALGFLFPPLLFLKHYQENISLSFFLSAIRSIQGGLLLIFMGVSLFSFSAFKENISLQEITQNFVASSSYNALVNSMSSLSFIHESIEQSSLKNISTACQGEDICISKLTEEFQSQSEEEKKEEVKRAVDTSLKEIIQILEKLVLVEKINESSSFSTIVFLLIFLIPFVRIFSGILGVIFVALFSLLKKLKILQIKKITVEKDYIY